MLSNHLRNSYYNYNTLNTTPSLSSTIKVDTNLNSENEQDNGDKEKSQHHHNHKILSTHEKVTALDSIVNTPSIMNTIILKSKLVNIQA